MGRPQYLKEVELAKMNSLIVIIGPSGIGKSFAVNVLCELFPDHFTRLKVYTTRPVRPSEVDVNDRVFVSKEQFDRMVDEGYYGVHYHFAGSRYGYSKQGLESGGKHIITNAPPFTLPLFTHYDNLVAIGLQTPADYSDFLRTRIEARGDTFLARKLFIERDTQDLEAMRRDINNRGKIFEVKDDSTISTEVLPWLTSRLGIG